MLITQTAPTSLLALVGADANYCERVLEPTVAAWQYAYNTRDFDCAAGYLAVVAYHHAVPGITKSLRTIDCYREDNGLQPQWTSGERYGKAGVKLIICKVRRTSWGFRIAPKGRCSREFVSDINRQGRFILPGLVVPDMPRRDNLWLCSEIVETPGVPILRVFLVSPDALVPDPVSVTSNWLVAGTDAILSLYNGPLNDTGAQVTAPVINQVPVIEDLMVETEESVNGVPAS